MPSLERASLNGIAGLYQRWRHLAHEMAKFGIVGAVNTVLDFGLANLLYLGLGWPSLGAKTASVAVAATSARDHKGHAAPGGGRDATSQDHHRRHLRCRSGHHGLHDSLHSPDPAAAPAPQVANTDPPVPTSPISHHRTQTDEATPTAPAAPRQLHFATPQAAMGYLASAYNRNDLAALKHVTTPEARNNPLFMRPNADNLRLVGCTANTGLGDFLCGFTHGLRQLPITPAPATRISLPRPPSRSAGT
jgi:hypothetical protein